MSAQLGVGALIKKALASGVMSSEAIIQEVAAARPEVSGPTVRARIAKLTVAGKIVRVDRGLYALPGHELAQALSPADVEGRIELAMGALLKADPDRVAPVGYKCVPFAVTDAVFSARQRYDTVSPMVKNLVDRFAEEFGLQHPTVEQFLEIASPAGLSRPPSQVDDAELIKFFGMATISPGAGNIPKARTTVAVLYRLHEDNLTTVEGVCDLDRLMTSLDGSGVGRERVMGVGLTTGRYITMLLGEKNRVKPDVYVIRWVKEAVGVKGWSPGSPEKVAFLVEKVARRFTSKYPDLTIGAIDSMIWSHMSGRSARKGRPLAPLRMDYQYLPDGTEVDWNPTRPTALGERWHGEVLKQVRPGRVLVNWSSTDATRSTKLSRTGEYVQEVPTMDLVQCTMGLRHPAQMAELIHGEVEVDWTPRRPTDLRKHGRVVFIDDESDMVVVRWLLRGRVDSPDGPNDRPALGLARRHELSVCDPLSDWHPSG